MNISLTVFKTKNNASFLARLPAAMASSQGNHLIWTEEEEVETQALKKIKTKQNKNQLQQKKTANRQKNANLKCGYFNIIIHIFEPTFFEINFQRYRVVTFACLSWFKILSSQKASFVTAFFLSQILGFVPTNPSRLVIIVF